MKLSKLRSKCRNSPQLDQRSRQGAAAGSAKYREPGAAKPTTLFDVTSDSAGDESTASGSPAQPPVPRPAADPATTLRIGDAERNAALTALGEHMAAGRLDLAEYETRSGVVAAARTAADLQGLFDDLPAPHPAISGLTPRSATTPIPQPQPATPARRGRAQAIAAGLAGSAGVIAVILFFLLNGVWDHAWLVFLLIPLVGGIAGRVASSDHPELPPGPDR